MKEEQTNEEKLVALRKALLKRKYFSIFLALFTLGVNIFAWFVFTATADVSLDATVAAWDVEFRDEEDHAMQDFVIDITKMKPGMDDYNKTITITTNSDVSVDFFYEITSFKLLGHTITKDSNEAMVEYLRSTYPFSVNFNASKNQMSSGVDEIDFDIVLTWPYESTTATYYKQDDAYEYESTLPYYFLSGGSYNLYNVASASAYNSRKTRLYLEKDDADTYFGMKCHEYEEESGEACLSLNVRLQVQQRNE